MTSVAPPLPRSEPLFEANGILAAPLILTPARLAVLWDRISQFPILFATPEKTSFEGFRRLLEDEETIVVGFQRGMSEPFGLGLLYDVIPGVEAKIQVSFFDSTLKGREALVRSMIVWAFDTLLVRRVASHVRADARSMRAFLERVGLYFEGVLKNWLRRENRLYDLYLYGITSVECDENWRAGHSWAKPRVKALEIYETH